MQTLMNYMMQSVDMFLWFYILAAALFLGKTAGLIVIAEKAKKLAFLPEEERGSETKLNPDEVKNDNA